MNKYIFYIAFLLLKINLVFSQETDNVLINADKKFINMDYSGASNLYEKFLINHPKDFYASRQAAISYGKINLHDKAIDHWTTVFENAEASEKDKFEYAKCLLANYRFDDAKKNFIALIKSNDRDISNWGKAYLNSNLFYEDSALCKVYAVEGFKYDASEFSPVLYKSELIYITDPAKKKSKLYYNAWDNYKNYSIFSSGKTDSVTYKKGKPFNKQIQIKYMNGPVCLTPDDSTLYFTRSATKKEMQKTSKDKNLIYKLQIFYTQINTFGLAHTEVHPFPYNSTTYDCMHPAIDRSGKKLYFSSDMPGSIGGKDIWMCTWNNGTWGTPQNLGSKINTKGNEVFPFITKDGVLYFASDNRPGLGGLDVFFANPLNNDQLFSEAENAGASINSQFDDFGIFIFGDGKRGYLTSNRKNGFRDDDIYFFVNNKPSFFPSKIIFSDSISNAGINSDFTLHIAGNTESAKLDSGKYFDTRVKNGNELIIKAESPGFKPIVFKKNISINDTIINVIMHPRSLKCIEGKIIDKENDQPLSGVKVAIYDEDGNNYLSITTDSSGSYKICNLPLKKDLYIGSEKKPEYFTNTERFRIKKDTDLLKDIYTQKIVIGKPIKIDNIYFDQGKFNVRPDAAVELDKVVTLMKDNPEVIIELSSHSDCTGPAAKNLSLSDKRAKSSADYIVKHGIDKKRIKGKGYGESQLINDCKCEGKVVSTCTEDQHAQNRRVEIKVTGFIKKK